MQIRHDAIVIEEEQQAFCYYSGISRKQLDILNVFETPDFKINMVKNYHALFVGGASSANVLYEDQFPFLQNCRDMLLYCLDYKIPVFASCFGFQLAVQALGEKIYHKDRDYEMGVLPIKLSPNASADPLFNDSPNPFLAITVHQQYADKVPSSCELLAYTDQCVHSFRVKDRPFWAFQFHPEVNKKILIERLTFYKQKYTQNDDHLDQVLAGARETPDANALVTKFAERVLLRNDGDF